MRIGACVASGIILVTALFLTAPTAQAQATRTWVSGVGDDANPCSRTAPCKTLAGAISKTAVKGEINVLDPGGFGAVTITKSISIEAVGVMAGVLAAGTSGIIVNAGANDVVVLRGLTIEGVGSGLFGIKFLAGGALHVENCTINGFTQGGIDFGSSTPSDLFVKDTYIRDNIGVGIFLHPTAAVAASIDGVRLERNSNGLFVQDGSNVTVRNSIAAGNVNNGFSVVAAAGSAELNIENSVATGNDKAGVFASGALATARISNTMITANLAGLKIAGAPILSPSATIASPATGRQCPRRHFRRSDLPPTWTNPRCASGVNLPARYTVARVPNHVPRTRLPTGSL